jgi:hypothetical protein
MVPYFEELLATCHNYKLEDHHFRLSSTACLIYWRLPFISGSRLLHPQPEDAPCRGDRDPHNVVSKLYINTKFASTNTYTQRRSDLIQNFVFISQFPIIIIKVLHVSGQTYAIAIYKHWEFYWDKYMHHVKL